MLFWEAHHDTHSVATDLLREPAGFQGDSPRPPWWTSVARWTYQSCRAFLEHLTSPHPSSIAVNGVPLRSLKRGSCHLQGGWDCTVPGHYAPGHYTAFRDYMLAYAAEFGSDASEGTRSAFNWDALIEGSYAILRDAQCATTGLLPNQLRPRGDGAGQATSCTAASSGAGSTPSSQYGALPMPVPRDVSL